MTTDYNVTELFCVIDEFCKHFDAENAGNLLEDNSGVKRRRRQASLSDTEIKGIATDGKGTMGWCHGFKLHLACNDRGEIIAFVLTGANVSDKDTNVFNVLAKRLYGKLFADKGYISQKLFDFLFEGGIQLVTGLQKGQKRYAAVVLSQLSTSVTISSTRRRRKAISLPTSRNWQTRRTPSGNTSICTFVPSRKASVPSGR